MQSVDTFMEQKEDIGGKQVSQIDRNQEIRGQNYAVISIICNEDPNDEPLIQFFQGFDSRDDARDYMRNTLHQTKIKTNCFVVQMYEWVVPIYTRSFKFKENVEASFTHTELEEIFKGQQWEKQKIDEMIKGAEAEKRLKEIQEQLEEEKNKAIQDSEKKDETVKVEPEEVD